MTSNKKFKKKRRKSKEQKKKRNKRKLAYQNYLKPFLQTIDKVYRPMYKEAYRWMHVPQTDDDFTPQIFQDNDPRSPETILPPQPNAPDDVVLKYVDFFTLSNYNTTENAEKSYRYFVDKLKKRKNKSVEEFIQNKGGYIVKVNYTEDVAIINEPDENGHFQALMFEDVDYEKLIDKAFVPIKIVIE